MSLVCLGLGDVGSDFERLNNAIVRASLRSKAWGALADDWQDRAVDERNWKLAFPPLWSSLMHEFWGLYAKLYAAEPSKAGLAAPSTIEPSGLPGALRDLYRPSAQALEPVSQAASAALAAVKKKTAGLLQAAGREMAKGAAEQTEQSAVNWGVVAAGVGILAVVAYYSLKPAR